MVVDMLKRIKHLIKIDQQISVICQKLTDRALYTHDDAAVPPELYQWAWSHSYFSLDLWDHVRYYHTGSHACVRPYRAWDHARVCLALWDHMYMFVYILYVCGTLTDIIKQCGTMRDIDRQWDRANHYLSCGTLLMNVFLMVFQDIIQYMSPNGHLIRVYYQMKKALINLCLKN